MLHQEGTFTGTKGVELYYQAWLPEQPPHAVVLISHGVADHSGRYQNIVDRLVAAGYAVMAHDHRGHGRSGGRKLHVERFQYLSDDLKTFRDLVAARYPTLPIYLFGHSLGSAIALQYVLTHPRDVAGLISSGTALLAGAGFPPLMLKLNRLLAQFLPYLRITALPTEGISRDAAWVEQTRRDPLIMHGRGTTRLAAETVLALAHLREHVVALDVPLLILHGEQDILTDIQGARLLYAQARSADKTLKLYPGAYHEVFNDLPAAREAILTDIVTWLDAHCLAPSH